MSVAKRGSTWSYCIDIGRDAQGTRQQRRRGGFPTKKAALAAEQAELVARRRHDFSEPNPMPLEQYLAHWLTETAGTHSDATHHAYATIVRVRIAPALGTVPLGTLDALTLSRFYRELGTRYAPTTVTATHGCLRAALRQAVRWRLIPRSPADDVTLAAGKAKEKTVWSAEEARRFLAAEADALFRFLLDSLCRLGEALALTWADVDLEAGVVRVNATRTVGADGKPRTRTGTKAGTGRRVELMPETAKALRGHRKFQIERRMQLGPIWHDLNLVFDRGDGEHYHPYTVRLALERACLAAGVPAVTPHGIRHTGATIAVAQGVPLHAVMQRLGHKDISLTANLYSHASPEADRQVAEALRRALEG